MLDSTAFAHTVTQLTLGEKIAVIAVLSGLLLFGSLIAITAIGNTVQNFEKAQVAAAAR